jgi:hypothetical protein
MSKASPGIVKLTAMVPVIHEDVGVVLGEEEWWRGEEAVRNERLHCEVEVTRGDGGDDVVVLQGVGGKVRGKVLLDERDDLRIRRR